MHHNAFGSRAIRKGLLGSLSDSQIIAAARGNDTMKGEEEVEEEEERGMVECMEGERRRVSVCANKGG